MATLKNGFQHGPNLAVSSPDEGFFSLSEQRRGRLRVIDGREQLAPTSAGDAAIRQRGGQSACAVRMSGRGLCAVATGALRRERCCRLNRALAVRCSRRQVH